MLWQVFASYYSKISSSSQIVIVMQNVIVNCQPVVNLCSAQMNERWPRGSLRWVHIRT